MTDRGKVTDSARAVVVGASVAGLLAASVLSGSYAEVTVYERDTLPAEPGPRRGVPQSRQLHGLHARGAQALSELLPGFRAEMIAAGAEQTVPADLVVDAAGRGSRNRAWLAQLGYPVPETSEVRAAVTYVCRLYSREPSQLDGRFGTLVTPYPGKPRGGAVLRQEGERFLVLLAGMAGAEPPTDEAGMLAFADSLACPDLAAVMRQSDPLGDPVKYTYPESAWHHYEALSRYAPGLLVIGDAFSSFNPIYGQGMTVAALQALALRELLSGAGPAAPDLERRYFRAAGKLVAAAWDTSASSDLRFPEVPGKRRPGAALINAYGEKYRAAASVDPVLGETFLRVANMIDKPARLLSPGHVVRVFRAAGKAVRAGS